jgi:hypothetical protein
MAASRASGRGGTYQTPVPPDAVAPLVPQYPLSASTTSAPASAAFSAAQVAAGPPPDDEHVRRELERAHVLPFHDVNRRSSATRSWLNTRPMTEIVTMPAYICGTAKLNCDALIR